MNRKKLFIIIAVLSLFIILFSCSTPIESSRSGDGDESGTGNGTDNSSQSITINGTDYDVSTMDGFNKLVNSPDAEAVIELQNLYAAVHATPHRGLTARVCFAVAIATARNRIRPAPLGFPAVTCRFGMVTLGFGARPIDSRRPAIDR